MSKQKLVIIESPSKIKIIEKILLYYTDQKEK
jgi:hypothetical protein